MKFGVHLGLSVNISAEWRARNCPPDAPTFFGFDTFTGEHGAWLSEQPKLRDSKSMTHHVDNLVVTSLFILMRRATSGLGQLQGGANQKCSVATVLLTLSTLQVVE